MSQEPASPAARNSRKEINMKTFEEQISKLEQIVNQLESGSCSLDDSLKLFEEGIKLSKSCHEMLEGAEKKVSVLINGEKQEFSDMEQN